MLLVIIAYVALLFFVYIGIALMIYVWIGGQSTVANTFSSAFVSVLDFYLMKEPNRDFIPIDELLLIYTEHTVLIQLIQSILILVFVGAVQIACSIAIEGARMNFQFAKSAGSIVMSDDSRGLYWLRSGIKKFVAKLWSN
jgi:hypothetical protein